MNIDQQQLKSLIEKKDWDGAKALLDGYFMEPMPEDQRGEAYVMLMELYLKVNNAMNERYSEQLEETLAQLRQAEEMSTKIDDDISLMDTRDILKE